MRRFTILSKACCFIAYFALIEPNYIWSADQSTPVKQAHVRNSTINIDLSEHKNIVGLSMALINRLIGDFQDFPIPNEVIAALNTIDRILHNMSQTNKFDLNIIGAIADLQKLLSSPKLFPATGSANEEKIFNDFISQLQTLKTLFEINILVQDLNDYFSQHKDEINKYKEDMIEISASIGAQIPLDSTGTISWHGDAGTKLQYGKQENGAFVENKQISLSQGLGASLPAAIKAKASLNTTLRKGKIYTGTKAIAANKSKLEKIKTKLSSATTREYLTYKQKLSTLLSLTKQLPVLLRDVRPLCESFVFEPQKSYQLSFSFKDGKQATEFMKQAVTKASISVSSRHLAKIGLSISAENRNIVYKRESDVLSALVNQEIELNSADYLVTLATVLHFEKQAKNLLFKQEKYFTDLIQSSKAHTAQKLLDLSTRYLTLLSQLASENIKKQDLKKFTKEKHEIEKLLKVTGRKQVIKALGSLLGYYAYRGGDETANTDQYIQTLEKVKQNIIGISGYLQYSNSIRKSKKHWKSDKVISNEQEVNISLMGDLIKFSCAYVKNNPNIYANGTDMKLTIDISKLNLANKVTAPFLRVLGIERGDMPVNELLEKILQPTVGILNKYQKRVPQTRGASRTISNLIQILQKLNEAMSASNDAVVSKNAVFNLITIIPVLSENAVSLVISAKSSPETGGRLTFLRSYITQAAGISVNANGKINTAKISTGGKVLIKTTSNNILENPNTLYTIAKSYIMHASAHDADNEKEITQNDALAFVNQYSNIDKIVESFSSGQLRDSLENYTQAIKMATIMDPNDIIMAERLSYGKLVNRKPEEMKKTIAQVLHLYYKYCAVPFKDKAYQKQL